MILDCIENADMAGGYLVGGFFILMVSVVWFAAGKLKEEESKQFSYSKNSRGLFPQAAQFVKNLFTIKLKRKWNLN